MIDDRIDMTVSFRNGKGRDEIGYDRAAQIAHTAHAERTTLKQAALKLGFVSADEFDRLGDPQSLRRLFLPERER